MSQKTIGEIHRNAPGFGGREEKGVFSHFPLNMGKEEEKEWRSVHVANLGLNCWIDLFTDK